MLRDIYIYIYILLLFLYFSFVSPIDHRFNSMKNEEGSESFSLSLTSSFLFKKEKLERIHFSFFLVLRVTEYFLFDFLFPLYTLSSSFVTRCHESLFSSGRKIPLRDTFEQTPYILLTPCCPRIFHKLYCFREFRRGRGGGGGTIFETLEIIVTFLS